ncbi:MAG: hypothetical protein KY445_10770 [Armatimonadetes bacterium]|nr:hypothetical protein [Armatimonadota bacterium]
MSETLSFQLSEEDIADAHRYGLQNALLYLISNRTGTLWRMSECGVGMEIMEPYRTFRLCDEDLSLWWLYQSSGVFVPCRLRIELHTFGSRPKTPQPVSPTLRHPLAVNTHVAGAMA